MITLFNGSYCNEQDVLRELVDRTGCRVIRDEDVVSSASSLSGLAANKIHKAFSGKASAFNTFTHEKERSIPTCAGLAEMLSSTVCRVTSHLSEEDHPCLRIVWSRT
jgi:hypothetical protein